jgi:hypothetical protein
MHELLAAAWTNLVDQQAYAHASWSSYPSVEATATASFGAPNHNSCQLQCWLLGSWQVVSAKSMRAR